MINGVTRFNFYLPRLDDTIFQRRISINMKIEVADFTHDKMRDIGL